MIQNLIKRGATVALASLATVAAFADSITPSSFSSILDVGESVTISKRVTVDAGLPVSSKVDVFFLADSTGSMGGPIAAVKASATSIMNNVSVLGDVAFGVGEYKDVGDSFIYRQNTSITTSVPTAQAGINLWGASGGGDFPEANLFALQEVANTAVWRAGSERVMVWFGDAPGHDPRSGATEASATAALVAKGVAVQAIDVGNMNQTGQAVRIANATGGAYLAGINSGTIVATITSLINAAVATYTAVGLDLSEVPMGISVVATPPSFSGTYDRSVTRTFDFQVTFTGNAAGSYDFNIYGTVDGGRVATEVDRITVIPTPDAGTNSVLLGIGACALGFIRRRVLA